MSLESPLSPAEKPAPDPSLARRSGLDELASGVTTAALHPILALLGVVGLAVAIFVMRPQGFGPSTCSLFRSTGIPCPSCGLTRSVTSIFHGRFAAAWEYNPFGFGFALMFVLFPLIWTLGPLRRQRLRERLVPHERVVLAVFAAFFLGMMVFGLVRGGRIMAGDPSMEWWKSGQLPPSFRMAPGEGDPIDSTEAPANAETGASWEPVGGMAGHTADSEGAE